MEGCSLASRACHACEPLPVAAFAGQELSSKEVVAPPSACFGTNKFAIGVFAAWGLCKFRFKGNRSTDRKDGRSPMNAAPPNQDGKIDPLPPSDAVLAAQLTQG